MQATPFSAASGVSWGDRKGSRRTALAVATVTALLVPGSVLGVRSPEARAQAPLRNHVLQVIVQATPGALAQAEHAVTSAGGTVTRQLGVVNGFSATIPSSAAGRVSGAPGVLAVTPDRVLHLQGSTYSPATDAGAPAAVQSQTGATQYWQNGLYGQGVGVALIDSGVSGVDGLRKNVFYGPDLTPQVDTPALRFLDTFGHGTFVAGLIGGRTDAAARPYTDPASFVGIAPEANLVSVKVADALGNTRESTVVAGVDWATQHMNDAGLNIRVLNLSVGVPGAGYTHDPLAAAVERAWGYGITVVASTGNDGSNAVDLPAADPYDIAVGALDSQNTPTVTDDTVASFSNKGDGSRNPDLVAPGTHTVSLRDPGSYIDDTFGSTGIVSSTLFRGSGTSEAAAITSGAAALVISQHPGITPDQVKALLMSSARSLPGFVQTTAGSGAVDLAGAYGHVVPSVTQSYPHALGWTTFSINLRGGSWLGNVWQSPSYLAGQGGSGGSLSGSVWSGSVWGGSVWGGSVWGGSAWAGNVWSGDVWSGNVWSGVSWR